MTSEEYKEYQRDQRDEAKQAAMENAKELGQFISKKVSGGYDHFDTMSSETYHESDICPSDEGDDFDEGDE